MNLKKSLLQFFLLLWKNFLLQFRRPIGTISEVLIPIFGMAVLILFYLALRNPQSLCFSTFNASSLQFDISAVPPAIVSAVSALLYSNGGNCNFTYFYTPHTPEIAAILNRTKEILQLPYLEVDFVPASSEGEVERLSNDVLNDSDSNPKACSQILSNFGIHRPTVAGLIFDQTDTEIGVTIRLRYSSRWNTDAIEPSYRQTQPILLDTYYTRGFLTLQDAISQSIIDSKIRVESGNVSGHEQVPIDIKQFPYPKRSNDNFLLVVNLLLPLLLVFSFIYTAGTITKEIVIDKQNRLKESMKMMGLLNWVNWLAWFTKQFIFMLFVIVCLSLELHFGKILPLSNFLIIITWLLLYVCYMISLSFLISTFFTSARLGMLVSFLVWFLSFFPYLFIFVDYNKLPLYYKLLACLLGNTCMAMSVNIFVSREIENIGIQWDNVASKTTATDPFNLLHAFGMFVLVILIQLVLTWYLDEALPKKYGLRKPFYFPFTPSYWFGNSAINCCHNYKTDTRDIISSLDGFEAEPADQEIGIGIQNLTKKYTRAKKALDNLTLNMYKGQITVLLGHNGAGKSTLISILTGLIPPTKGDAQIHGMGIRSDMDDIRNHLGICPQSNILIDRMTVKEHLHFFIRLKGIWNWFEAKKNVQKMLVDTKLEDKVNTLSTQLSGGMKRRLSVGLALIGDTKIIILDEPTSGVDPYARRTTWDLLLKYKQDRTILLTTHHMDEADVLGDRIAILTQGVLRSCGSSLFLKNKFGVGYYLTMVKTASFDKTRVTQTIHNYLPSAFVNHDMNTEISYIIPSYDTGKFAQLFELFENNSRELGIESYGISHTTMEDVFRKVSDSVNTDNDTTFSNGNNREGLQLTSIPQRIPRGSLTHSQEPIIEMNQNSIEINQKTPNNKHYSHMKLNHGVMLWFQQLWAMIIKKGLYSFRRYGFIILQIILPLFFTLLGLTLIKFNNRTPGQDPSIRLTVDRTFPNSDKVSMFHMKVPGITQSLLNDFTLNHISNFSQLNSFAMENDILNGYTDILNSIQNYNQTGQCCNYEFQMLDEFCGHRIARDFKKVDLCGTNPNFGYSNCIGCLQCLSSDTCPKPPPIGYDPTQPKDISGMSSGPLAVDTVYIDEYLLREMSKNVYEFYSDYLLGITTNKMDPPPYEEKCLCCSEKATIGNNITGNSSICKIDEYLNDYCVNPGIGVLYPNTTVRPERVTLWYNNQAYHTTATGLSVLHNYIFYNAWNQSGLNGIPPEIVIKNHPLPRIGVFNTYPDLTTGFSLAVFLTFGLSFLTSSFIIFPLQEKSNRSKFLQFVSGLSPLAYWIGIFLWDLVITLISCTLVFIPFPCFDIPAFSGTNLLIIFLLLISYGFGSLTMMYFFSFLFKSSLFAFALSLLLLFFSYQILNIIVIILRFVANDVATADLLSLIFSVFPNYSFANGINQMYNNSIYLESCQQNKLSIDQCRQAGFEVSENLFTFEKPGVLIYIIVPIAMGVLFFALTLLIESLKLDKLFLELFFHRKGKYCEIKNEDHDIAMERNRISRPETKPEAVFIQNLSKVFPGNVLRRRKAKLAVNQICLGIAYGECFGLLGVNGAGKTTTFEMLAGNLRCTSGTALLAGFDIRKNLRKVRQNVGYCPQFDALQTYMSGKQLLSMYARIRGVPSSKLNELVQLEIERMGLEQYASVQCQKYSGGNKRKLSAACSLIGNAPILLLDEPTTGMDPNFRRFFWGVLENLIQEGRCIVLSSHSMEECEALCTNLAIMVNGEFKCLGSTQHLKNKFGDEYTLSIRFRSSGEQDELKSINSNIQQFIAATFQGAKLVEVHSSLLEYRLSSKDTLCSAIFKELEGNKDRLGILDYGVSQTTLDQVFVNFAKKQVTEDSN